MNPVAIDFPAAFKTLTENAPFPWQEALFAEFVAGGLPEACDLPTGLGKTSVIAVWLLALAATDPGKVPRRLVYVVNRRTVVDQSTRAAEQLRNNLAEVPGLFDNLAARCSIKVEPGDKPLAISTLRGQFADNREWSADPARPAVVVGTVDMVGSRLLFEGYGCGFKTRPLHAGFLCQDALLVNDEAHLEPAFQELLDGPEGILRQQECEESRRGAALPWSNLRVMQLTATPRTGREPFRLTDLERAAPVDPPEVTKGSPPVHHVWRRLRARKGVQFLTAPRNDVARMVGRLALRHKDAGKAVLIFVRSVGDVKTVREVLTDKKGGVADDRIATLTGTIRGRERDRLADPTNGNPVFARFVHDSKVPLTDDQKAQTVYLICTSAGEVGVDISADHMVSDLTPLDSMAQRFGRVNRRGSGAAEIDVVCESDPDPKKQADSLELARWGTLAHFNSDRLPFCGGWAADRRDVSPAAIGALIRALSEAERAAAFSPKPGILPVSDILFDAWALTSVRGPMPGRPRVEDWLHGVDERELPETHVAWRKEVELLTPVVDDDAERKAAWDERATELGELLDEFPLKPHELLRDATYRVQEALAGLAKRHKDRPVWVIDSDDTVHIMTLGEVTKQRKKEYVVPLNRRTVILPPEVGGLRADGTLDGDAGPDEPVIHDVCGLPTGDEPPPFVRVTRAACDEPFYKPIAGVCGLPPNAVIARQDEDDERTEARLLRDGFDAKEFKATRVAYRLDLAVTEVNPNGPVAYLVLKRPNDRRKQTGKPAWPLLDEHNAGVGRFADALCKRLSLSGDAAQAVMFAAGRHDLGKDRAVWQRGAGNKHGKGSEPGNAAVAKTLHGRPPENLNGFRHELASLIDVRSEPEHVAAFGALSPGAQELTLHLIAAHHGRARPHFPANESTDPERLAGASVSVVLETPGRYARLQRQYGRWGLAYLESLIRAADALDSRRIENDPLGREVSGAWPRPAPPTVWTRTQPLPEPSIRVGFDPTNPGQFFACCGLLELASRAWPGAEGWFAGREFHIAHCGSLPDLLRKLCECRIASSLSDQELKRLGTLLSAEKDKLSAADLAEKETLRRGWQLERMHFSEPFDFWVDWWHDQHGDRTELKTWASKQQVLPMLRAMQSTLRAAEWWNKAAASCLGDRAPADTLPFNFDSGLSGSGAAIDVGFSLDEHQLKLPFRPLVELSAFVGIQRFRPRPAPQRGLFRFGLWPVPLPPSAAAPVAAGLAHVPGVCLYEFRLLDRSQYAKAFLPAQPVRGDDR